MSVLSNFKVVLVETSHPGNIGAVARAMKNMELSRLCLVAPKQFPHADATARAAGADDVLRGVQIAYSLQAAVADCQIVLGASARDRTRSWPMLTARQCAEQLVGSTAPCHNGQPPQIALVFGRENSGLTNDELDLCHYLLRIPCNEAYSSLNVAQAVQVVCYELFIAATAQTEQPESNRKIGDSGEAPLATGEQMEAFYAHLLQAIEDIGFLRPEHATSMMRRLRRIYNRIQLDTKELDILRGILRFSQNYNGKYPR